jgi:cysteinyl-tRNA synthetase
MNVDGQKMSKSLGNTYTLKDLVKFAHRGTSASAFRYWLLNAHYRTLMNFSQDAFSGAEDAYASLLNKIINLSTVIGTLNTVYMDRFTQSINNDLDTHSAITLMWDLIKDDTVSNPDKLATIFKFDEVFGLKLRERFDFTLGGRMPLDIHLLRDQNPTVHQLYVDRQHARNEKNWAESDRLRDEIAKLGYGVKDTPEGQVLSKL